MREGVDYSGPRPTAAAMRAAGRDFVVRYVSSPGGIPKDITRLEADYWRANGIDIAIVFEDSAGRALTGGRAGGAADARTAVGAVRAAGGPTDGGVIYVAVDVDVSTAAQLTALAEYLRGWATVVPANRLGVYGELAVVRHALDLRLTAYGWQTYAWSAGQWDARAQLQQYRNAQLLGGVAVDYCRAPAAAFGQWPGASPVRRIPEVIQLAGTAPALRYGDRDPVPFKGGNYVSRVQRLLGVLPVDGIYGDRTAAAVKVMNARLLGRTVDGRTVDGACWERLYGIQG